MHAMLGSLTPTAALGAAASPSPQAASASQSVGASVGHQTPCAGSGLATPSALQMVESPSAPSPNGGAAPSEFGGDAGTPPPPPPPKLSPIDQALATQPPQGPSCCKCGLRGNATPLKDKWDMKIGTSAKTTQHIACARSYVALTRRWAKEPAIQARRFQHEK